MTDPMREIIRQFPDKRELILQLRESSPKFDALCLEYAIVNEKLTALAQTSALEVTASASALSKRRTAIEEELLTAIEGYSPA
jgi:uncharacterized protein YdcH (DUF465 family)